MPTKRQSRLIEPQIDTSDLLGPDFTPEPGWGGHLSTWLRAHGLGVIRTAAALAILFFFLKSFEARISTSPTASLTPTPIAEQTIAIVVRPTEGLSAVAARALAVYANLHPSATALDPIQHAFAIDALARSAGWRSLSVGETITFTPDTLASILQQAENLTIAQRAAWARYAQ